MTALNPLTELERDVLGVLRGHTEPLAVNAIRRRLLHGGWEEQAASPNALSAALARLEELGLARNHIAFAAVVEEVHP